MTSFGEGHAHSVPDSGLEAANPGNTPGSAEFVPPGATQAPPGAPWELAATPAPSWYPVQADMLAGMFFWWDTAPPSKKGLYHGRILGVLDGGYALLGFAPHEALPRGVHELVHIARIAEEAWSLFATEADYLAALEGAR